MNEFNGQCVVFSYPRFKEAWTVTRSSVKTASQSEGGNLCGIAGIVNFDGRPVDRADLQKMTDTLAHRGPDAQAVWIDGHVGFGHRRLAIRDLSDAGAQPIQDRSAAATVTYNGEIYNDLSIRAALEARGVAPFTSTCDTEVIAPGYREWGLEAFFRLEGMYALGLWDHREQRLVLARDPIGIKPLYYSRVGRSLRFASEIKALLSLADQPRSLNSASLHRYFAQGYAGPERTLVEGIFPLPPGCILVADRQSFRIERFWQPKRSAVTRNLDEALFEFDALWDQVVKDQLISDVPLGLLLSGGIDSALVASALKHHPEVSTYTATFGDRSFDESSLAAVSAQQAGLSQELIAIDTQANLEAVFRDVVAKTDGQLADSSSLAFYALCQRASKKVKVLLTGDGADEFFAGYETYGATMLAHIVGNFVPSHLARLSSLALFASSSRKDGRIRPAEKAARFFAGLANGSGNAHPQWRRYLFPEAQNKVYGSAMRSLLTEDPMADYASSLQGKGGVIDRALIADQSYYLPGDLLMKSDSMSMAHGVEVRVPFLDRRIMEFANGLDLSLLRTSAGQGKRILRRALTRRGLPPGVTKAPKQGFNIPVAAYLAGPLRTVGDKLLDAEADCLSPFLDAGEVRRMWRRHIDGDLAGSYALWTFLSLAVWRTSAGI